MFPAAGGTAVDIEALSGICGSISIACWIVVYSPQIIENFRRQSADGLSIVFLVIWSLGDLFNVIGGVLQGVLPTMIILALYYALADSVLIGQAFYYRGFTLSDAATAPKPRVESDQNEDEEEIDEEEAQREEQPLLTRDPSDLDRRYGSSNAQRPSTRKVDSQPSHGSSHVDATHLSPAVPLVEGTKSTEAPAIQMMMPTTGLQSFFFNLVSILIVCGAGIFGWWIGQRSGQHREKEDDVAAYPEYNLMGQIFGYLCAAFYLGSRVPQLLLNFQRKSTEGVSLLFFLFACVGNLTYIMAIFAYEPACEDPHHCMAGEVARIYGRYIAVNTSWIIGSAGTFFLDLVIFWQFFLYRKGADRAPDDEANGSQTPNGMT